MKTIAFFLLKSLTLTKDFHISTQGQTDLTPFLREFKQAMEIEESKTGIYCLYRKTEKLVDRLQKLVNQLTNKHPEFNQLPAWIREIPENDYFFFIWQPLIDQLGHILLNNTLVAINTGRTDLPQIQQLTQTLLQDLFKKYTCHQYGKERSYIGEADKTRRICRYCGKSEPATIFKNTAHAIPEALNNKHIVCREECDSCNEWLGNNVEQHLINYLAFWRTLYQIPGKEGQKKYTGKDFEMDPAGKIHVRVDSPLDDPAPTFPITFSLTAVDKFSPQNIYKAFCKMVVCVLPKQYLSRCQPAIDWIMGRREITQLPPVWHKQVKRSALQSPELLVYVKKEKDRALPGIIGEFSYAQLKFVFILPLCETDEMAFLSPDEFEIFWKTFKHLGKMENWQHQDFSSVEKKTIGFMLTIEDPNRVL